MRIPNRLLAIGVGVAAALVTLAAASMRVEYGGPGGGSPHVNSAPPTTTRPTGPPTTPWTTRPLAVLPPSAPVDVCSQTLGARPLIDPAGSPYAVDPGACTAARRHTPVPPTSNAWP